MTDSNQHSIAAALRQFAQVGSSLSLPTPKQTALAAADEIERLVEQKEAADRVLAVADQLAEWCRVTTSVEGVFSNNLGAQAQGQGMANLVVRYAAARERYPAKRPT